MSMIKKIAFALTIAVAALTVVGCGTSGSTTTGSTTGTTGSQTDTSGATIIDVRTAAEFAAGHLQGAVNIDVQSADFGTTIANLPKDGTYIVYCQSGVRAGNAQSQMKAAGFTDVTNAGGIAAAAKSTGLPIVTS
ncbi:MAG: rhodanese-like domain-containing protein [Propionibacteriaceae bacterium]|nr:rhodanese-like domain-containing protein [Propionibacteriaceae bacterium]